MDYRSLVSKLEAIERGEVISEATAPTSFKPNYFHKGNLGNKMPVMLAPDGTWWWETSGNPELGQSGTVIAPWNGNTENRSGWNPASIDGAITPDGKYIDFPEGVTWKMYKEKADKDKSDRDALLAKLKQLVELVDKYLALKTKKAGGATTGQNPNIDDATRERAKASVSGLKEGLLESFGYETQVDELAIPAGVAAAGSTASKMLGRAAPGVGAYLGAQGAYDSWKKGDYLGAALNGLSGAFSLVPGLGWIPAVGFGMWQAGRELSGAADAAGQKQSGQGSKPGGDQKLAKLQKMIGATPDGIMGPETKQKLQAWQQKQGITADGIPGPETYGKAGIKEGVEMKSLAESMKELQQRLAVIESEQVEEEQPQAEPASSEENSLAKQLEQAGGQLMEKDGRQFMVIPSKGIAVEIPSMEIVDASTPALTPTGKQFDPASLGLSEGLEEGIWDSILKGAASLGKNALNIGKNFSSGLKGANASGVRSAAGRFTKAGTGARLANNAGKAISKNPLKAGALAGAAGLGLGLANGPGAATTAQTGGGAGGQSARPVQTAPAGGDDEEMKALRAQIDALIKELSTSQDPEIQKGLADVQSKLK